MIVAIASEKDSPPQLRLLMLAFMYIADATLRAFLLCLIIVFYVINVGVVAILCFIIYYSGDFECTRNLVPLVALQVTGTTMLLGQLIRMMLQALMALIFNALLDACGIRGQSEAKEIDLFISSTVFKGIYVPLVIFAVVDSSYLTYLLNFSSLCRNITPTNPVDCTAAKIIVLICWAKIIPAFVGLLIAHIFTRRSAVAVQPLL